LTVASDGKKRPAESSYSNRLGTISEDQFQAALDRFDLGEFRQATAIRFGLFGQNVFLTSTTGEYVLRGAAHYEWQFPAEQFMARLLHGQSDVAVPWPYLYDSSDVIFGWKWGYVLMPKMPGIQLADGHVVGSLSKEDRRAIARALGENLSEVHQVHWECSGQFDLAKGSISAFPGGFGTWLIDQLQRLVQQSEGNRSGFAVEDREWIDGMINDARAALEGSMAPSLVLHDYKEANVTVDQVGGRWTVSGVFDLMESFFGDGDLDFARQFGDYCEVGRPDLATSFLTGYLDASALQSHMKERLRIYLAYDRLIIWEYFHRPEHLAQWWHGPSSFRDWARMHLDHLDACI
jgi:hygromycin-B 7''-O-kinase